MTKIFSFSLDQQRSLETDFWIFLVACFYLRVLKEKKFFSDKINGQNGTDLSSEESSTGAFLIRVLRVIYFLISCPVFPHLVDCFRFFNSTFTVSCKLS